MPEMNAVGHFDYAFVYFIWAIVVKFVVMDSDLLHLN